MKQIVAYIKPHRLQEVTRALLREPDLDLRGMSVSTVQGFGKRGMEDASCRTDAFMDYAPYTRVEIFCRADIADRIVSVIDRKAKTGFRGDGKIYVLDVVRSYKVGKGDIE
jgi:nitrogen regulatory protein PII